MKLLSKKHKFDLIILLFTCLFVLAPDLASARALEINYPKIPGAEAPQDFLKTASSNEIIALYIKYIFNFSVWIAGLLILAVLLYAGLKYLLSAGKAQQIRDAKNMVFSAFLGALILFSSVLIFKTINPVLPIIDISGLTRATPINYPDVPEPPERKYQSRIYTEIPFGTIIDKIFETTENQRPKEKQEKQVPRLKRIELLTGNTVKLAANLENQSNTIEVMSNACMCKKVKSEGSGGSCSCDPCIGNPRRSIEENEKKNVADIQELRNVQQSIKEEARLLDAEIEKLEKAEKFMMECELQKLRSLAANLEDKKYLMSLGYDQPTNKYWKSIFIDGDFGTFYCPVSGSLFGTELNENPAYEEPAGSGEGEEEPEEFKREERPPACSKEVPVGQLIDRTERLGHKLSSRMIEIVSVSQELIEAVNKFQATVSECTSQLPRCRWDDDDDECKNADPEGACPKKRIREALDKIKEIKNKIEEDIANSEDANNIGILPAIQKIAPQIIQELASDVREPMRRCVRYAATSEYEAEQTPVLRITNCMLAYGMLGPGNIMIENCCARKKEYQESGLGQPPNTVQDYYRECLQQCYASQNYGQCLTDCLSQKGQNFLNSGDTDNAEKLSHCRPSDNYFCCNP